MSSKTQSSTLQLEISEELTVFDVDTKCKDVVIEDLADLFLAKNIVHDSYLDAVLERERHIPTGLITKVGGIAIPHTDPEYVKRSAIAIGRMKEPVKFNNMANPKEQVDVNVVFLLAIADKEQVNPVLSKMAELLQNEIAFKTLLEIDNPRDFVAYFSKMLSTTE
mgnify:CR=1 FL=1